jgi:hypothetical protein
LGEGTEKQHPTAHGAQHHKATQLSVALTQQESKKDRSHRQTVNAVQNSAQSGQPQPKGAQQVIQRSGGQPQ